MRKFASPLLVLALCTLSIIGSRAQGSPAVFINEFHFDNASTDIGEFIEIAGPAGTNLSTYSIVLYNGSTPASAQTYNTKVLSGVIPNQQNGFGTLSFEYPSNGIQNGPNDAIALVQGSSTVIQFLSYQGVTTAGNGPAAGMVSQDIGVTEGTNTPVGSSLRLIGSGSVYGNFSWAAPAPHSAGSVNQGQTFIPQGDSAPAVTSTSPAANASNVAVASTIVINFSESINATSSAFSLACGGSPQLFTQSASPSSSITLTPSANLPFGASCVVTVTANQVTDTDLTDPPDQMAANFTFSFTTVPPVDPAPVVLSTIPADGAIDVDPATNITINFSEPVTASTNAFTIQCGGASVSFGQPSVATSSFVLDPFVNLPPSSQCTVTMNPNEVSDFDGNDPPDHPISGFALSFTTATPVATNVVINELDADTPGDDAAEFVELYDGGVGHTLLTGLTVVFYNGSSDTSYAAYDLDGLFTNDAGYFTIGNPGVSGVDLEFLPGQFGFLQNGADAVALVIGNATSFPSGTGIGGANVLDAIVYDTDDPDDTGLLPLLNGGQPQVNENGGLDSQNQSVGRCADGAGGARNTLNYRAGTPSPDGANHCPPPPGDSPIVISQFYGAGGNDGALYQNDFVELYNRSSATVDITGWTLQYAAAAGSGWDFNKTPLGGPIPPHAYYLVKLASGGATGQAVPEPNVSGPINMSGTSGKIALVSSVESLTGECPLGHPNLMDMVGYGAANCAEGNTRAPELSLSTSDFRINGGETDTNRNFEDFTSGAPNPNRRTAPIVELGPFLLSADPSTNGFNVPRDPTVVLTFTEPVTVTAPWFEINCLATGHHDTDDEYSLAHNEAGTIYDITLNRNLLAGEKCTITVFKDQVRDVDSKDSEPNTDTLPANYSWSFTVATGTLPLYPPSVHLTFGNPTNAENDLAQFDNYLMDKAEYALSYNRTDGRPNWVSWHLSDDWYGTLTRVDTFRADPQIPDSADWYRVQGFDFSGSGFDRGHMVPNADRDKETSVPINQATYLMTNMLAQAPDNNQGPWAAFENELRAIADGNPATPNDNNEIYIVAGPYGQGGTGGAGFATKIANTHVLVPQSTWKVALVLPKAPGDDLSRVTCATRTIAVIMPNVQGIRNHDWHQYLVSVDAVEALTGYDLFSNLPPGVEYCVEAGINGTNPSADTTPPAIVCEAADGAWHGDNVTLTCTATDSESKLANAADGSFTLATLVPSGVEDGNAATDTRLVCDKAGNCATAGPIGGNKIDRKNPTITLTSPLNGATFELNQSVASSFSCADDGSGLVSCIGNVVGGSPIDTASSGVKAFIVTALDAAGNMSTASATYTVSTGPAHKRNPSISINNIPTGAQAGGSFTPAYLYDGDGVIHLASQTPAVCKIKADSIVMFVGTGTCTVVASATPTGSVNPALGPLQSFVIVP